MASPLLVSDLIEKETTAPKPLQDDDFGTPSTGFPTPKKKPRVSAFRQRRAAAATAAAAFTPTPSGAPQPSTPSASQSTSNIPKSQEEFYAAERKRIDQENRQLIDAMSPEEIAEAQRELRNGLNPAFIERLLRRANIEEKSSSDSVFAIPPAGISEPAQPPPTIKVEDTSIPAPAPAPAPAPSKPKATETNPSPSFKQPMSKGPNPHPIDEDRPPAQIPSDLFPITDPSKPDATNTTHFPSPQSVPELDPSDPDFLESLHKKYFPTLPADPSKLAWMAPLPTEDSQADKESPYYPGQDHLSTSSLRFDFNGRLLPPRLSRSIPTDRGLHHHGQAPEAAGYTVEELCILARSAVPAQRCIAYRTLGRILFRLGNGEWGTGAEDPVAMGVWHSIKEGRALDSLAEEALKEGGHRSCQAYATEAIWLYEKGGWKEKLSGR